MAWSRQRICTVFLAVALAIVMATPLGLLSTTGMSEPWQAEETVLRIGFLDEVDSLNPFVGLSEASHILYGLVYDCLQGVGNDLQATPNLAREFWIVPDTDPQMILSGEPYGSVWQYNLSQDARWVDGEPFTADDVVWTINLYSDYHESFWAYQPYAFFMNFAEAMDEFTVRVHFYDRETDEPIPVAYGSQIQMPVLPRHVFESVDPGYLAFAWNGTPIIGTGPFVAGDDIYDEWLAGDTLTLLRNPDYHGSADYGQLVHFDKVQFRFFDDVTSMVLALQSGLLDLVSVPPAVYLALKSDVQSGRVQDVALFGGARPDNYFVETLINMNLAGPNPSRLDPVIRHALAMTTNKSYVVDNFYYGLAEEGSTLISPANEMWHHELPAGIEFEFNKTAAATLLDGAGYIDTNSDGIRECTASSLPVQEGWVLEGKPLEYEMMVRREHPEEKDIVQYLKYEWAQIGINLNFIVMDEAEMALNVYCYEYDMAVWDWSADPDPNFILFTQTEKAWYGWSDTLYSSPHYEENYSASVSALDIVERKTRVDACQRVHYLDAPYIIIGYPNQTVAWRTDTFEGWGNWEEDPGRSLFNSWSGNPLYFDLIPTVPVNNPPSITGLNVHPNPAEPAEAITFEVSASDLESDPLVVTIEFGDGVKASETTAGGTPLTQKATFYHAYSSPGLYSVRIWANDCSGLAANNVTVLFEDRVVVTESSPVVVDYLPVAVPGDDISVFVGEVATFDGSSSYDDHGIVNWTWRFLYGNVWIERYGVSANFTFGLEGVYQVNLTVTDTAGQTNWSLILVTVTAVEQDAEPSWLPVIALVTAVIVAAAILSVLVLTRRRRLEGT